MVTAADIHIAGIVQGVGFRPFVYRLASQWNLNGWVFNASDGVHIHIEGGDQDLEGFLGSLPELAPQAARITSVQTQPSDVLGAKSFEIRASRQQERSRTQISPDIATCADCLRELFDPNDRRYLYPFINCTNCGPRFTIIEALPYDRQSTSMAVFPMCSECSMEYHDPADRRFHAQPDACFECGPQLSLWENGTLKVAADPEQTLSLIEHVAELLNRGMIVAIKGLGGYHLACSASDELAVERLRARKHRYGKPFALMVASLADAETICQVNSEEAALLTGTIRPIVLLERKPQQAIAPSVAGGLHELGIMLPYTPLQHLLLEATGCPLVMTSGNISEEPILAQESEAHDLLANVADAFLDHNRAILSRYDDSVIRVVNGQTTIIRRARGYAPAPLSLPRLSSDSLPVLLATGPEQKSTFCLVSDNEAYVSQHIGDLESAATMAAWLTTLELYKTIFDLEPQVVAADMHPEYLAAKWARAQELPIIEVQHHHAHIAAVLAEHKAQKSGDAALIERVIGVAFDGTGYGEDHSIWGGEVLLATLQSFGRFAHVAPVLMPGGQAAIEHPDRMAYSYLATFDLLDHPGATDLKSELGEDRCLLLDQILKARLNSPETSSMGRLFDAVSAILGIKGTIEYEGQAAIELEAALYDTSTEQPVIDREADSSAQRYQFHFKGDQQPMLIDPSTLLQAVLDDYAGEVPTAVISLRFHQAVVRCIVDICNIAREISGLGTVALSGGVFMNRFLLAQVVPLLESEGFTVLQHLKLPVNDGCISYGQAAVAAAQIAQLQEEGRSLV